MASFDLSTADDTNVKHTVVLDFEPFDGEVEIDIAPKTRALVLQAIEKAKSNPKSRRRVVRDPNDPKRKIVHNPNENAAFMDELADLLILDWRGVEDSPGVPAECTRENKIRLFNNLKVSNFILEVADDLAGTVGEAEEGK